MNLPGTAQTSAHQTRRALQIGLSLLRDDALTRRGRCGPRTPRLDVTRTYSVYGAKRLRIGILTVLVTTHRNLAGSGTLDAATLTPLLVKFRAT